MHVTTDDRSGRNMSVTCGDFFCGSSSSQKTRVKMVLTTCRDFYASNSRYSEDSSGREAWPFDIENTSPFSLLRISPPLPFLADDYTDRPRSIWYKSNHGPLDHANDLEVHDRTESTVVAREP